MSDDLECMGCHTKEGVKMWPSRTAYYWDGKGDNPNAPVPLCEDCGKEHDEYWAEMWSYANGGY